MDVQEKTGRVEQGLLLRFRDPFHVMQDVPVILQNEKSRRLSQADKSIRSIVTPSALVTLLDLWENPRDETF